MKIEDKELIAKYLGYTSQEDSSRDVTYWYKPTDINFENRLYIDDLKFNNWKTIGKLLKKIEKEEGIHTDFMSCFYSKCKKTYDVIIRKENKIIVSGSAKTHKKTILKTVIKYLDKK